MATTPTAEEIARAILKQIGGRPSFSTPGNAGSKGSSSPSARASAAKDDKILRDNTSAIQYLRDTLRKNNSLIGEMNHITKASNKVFDHAIDSIKDLKELESLPAKFQKTMMNTNSSLVKMMSQKMDSLESMFATQEKIEKLPQVQELMKEFANGKILLSELDAGIQKLGFTVKEAEAITSKFGKELVDENGQLKTHKGAVAAANYTVKQFDKEIKAANLGVADFAANIEKETSKPTLIQMVKGFKESILGALAADVLDAAQASMKFGTELNLLRSHFQGMKPEEYSKLQADNRQAINALTGGFSEFDSLIANNNKELTAFTGSLKDSTMLVAGMVTTSRLMGSASVDTVQFVNSQKKVFEDFNRHLSMTSEEFTALNERLVQDADIRGVLYKMNEKQRQAHFEGLQQEYKTYRIMGLLPGQAENLVKAMDKLSGKGAKDRLKESAKLRAIMGGMGIAGGERAQQLMLKGQRMTPQEKQELAGILKDANETVSDRLSSDYGSELLTDAMIQKTNLENLLGPNSIYADAILGKGAAAKTPPQDAVKGWTSIIGEKGDKIVGAIINFQNILMSFLGTSFITALVLALGSKSILGSLGNLLGKGKGGMLDGALSKVGGKLLPFAEGGAIRTAGMLSVGAGVLGTTAMIGKDAYDIYNGQNNYENKLGVGGGLSGAVIGGMIGSIVPVLGTAIGASIGGALGNWTGEKLGKWMDSNYKEDNDAQKAKQEQNEKLQAAIQALTDAINTGNDAAIKTAQNTLNTQLAVAQQTTQQQTDAQKAREAQNAAIRKIQIRDRTGTALSPQ